MSKSHLAGELVTIGGRYQRQLCMWCGFRLIDRDLSLIATEDGRAPGQWEVGAWVQHDGPVRRITTPDEPGKLPLDACTRDVLPTIRAVPDMEPTHD